MILQKHQVWYYRNSEFDITEIANLILQKQRIWYYWNSNYRYIKEMAKYDIT